MIKILIADDETIVLDTLKKTIDWENLGFSIVGLAKNGATALEIAKETSPDILLTDICMPAVNGMTLIEELKKINPAVEILILTGYSDFSYAHSAFDFGVYAYILKPFKNEELTEKLLELKEKILNQRTNSYANIFFTIYQNGQFFQSLLQSNKITQEQVMGLQNKYNLKLPETRCMVGIMQIDNASQIQNLGGTHTTLMEITTCHIGMSNLFMLIGEVSEKELMILIYSHDHFMNALNTLNEIRCEFCSRTGHTITIGISGYFRNLTLLSRAYAQAASALSQKAVLGKNRVIDYISIMDCQDMTPTLSVETKNQIITGISASSKQDSLLVLEKYFEKLETLPSINLTSVKNSITELLLMITHTYISNSSVMATVFPDIPHPVVDMFPMELIGEIKNYTINFVNQLLKYPELCLKQNYSVKIQQAILYIFENYKDPITIHDLAKKLLMSESAFMRLFKTETGKTFIEYLTEYRLNIAKKLIETKQHRIYEVCEMVGYRDIAYFSKIYKKHFGQCPSE